MTAIAKLRYLRIAPRKVRLVTNMIRGKRAQLAQTILQFTPKQGTEPILKVLNSAIAAAKNNSQIDASNLYISKITVDEGPKYKRFMPRARGRAYPIQKKTSHISIVLDEIELASPRKAEPKRKPLEQDEQEQERKARKTTQTRPKFRAEKETIKPKKETGIRRMFRRKTA